MSKLLPGARIDPGRTAVKPCILTPTPDCRRAILQGLILYIQFDKTVLFYKLFPMFIVWRVELLARVADNDFANINPSPFAPILRSVKVVFTIKALQIAFYCLKILNGPKMKLDRKFRGIPLSTLACNRKTISYSAIVADNIL